MKILGEPVTIRRIALALLLVAMEGDTETTALSKGPLNPADIGSRCAAMAGREDRAYLHCAEQAQRPATTSQGHLGTFFELPSLDHSAIRPPGDTRRYPLRRP